MHALRTYRVESIFSILFASLSYKAVTRRQTSKNQQPIEDKENKYWNYIDFVLVYDHQEFFRVCSIRSDSLSNTSSREWSSFGGNAYKGPAERPHEFN